jgi:hypothetical protein
MQEKKQIISIVIVALVVVAIIGVVAYFGKGKGGSVRPGFYEGQMSLEKISELSLCPLTTDKDVFAKCLTEKGWTMYGAEWCAHCKDQKELFGASFQYIKYVECPDNVQLCIDKGINGYPTWIVEK